MFLTNLLPVSFFSRYRILWKGWPWPKTVPK